MLSLNFKEQGPLPHSCDRGIWGCVSARAQTPGRLHGTEKRDPGTFSLAQTSCCSPPLPPGSCAEAKEMCLALTFSHMFQMCRGVIVNNVISRARAVCSYRALFPAPQGFQ